MGWQLGETLFNASQYRRARAALYESHELRVSRHSAQNWSAKEDPAEQPPAPSVPAVAEKGAARRLVFVVEQFTYGLSVVDQWEDPRPEEAQVALEFPVVDEAAGNVILDAGRSIALRRETERSAGTDRTQGGHRKRGSRERRAGRYRRTRQRQPV